MGDGRNAELSPLPTPHPPPTPCVIFAQDHITLADYEIHDGMGLELYYN